jgi:cysteinyl-tRNA synthetase
MPLLLHNTLTKKTEPFTPLQANKVTLYTCGPTVYNRLHVGNWFGYIMWDILVRTLIANGFIVERVMNITDVGHLVSDEDEGEDKLQKGARREGKTAWEIAEYYSEDFIDGLEKLGLIAPEHIAKATDYIPQQLDLVRSLKERGYTYQISEGIYFDTSRFPTYAEFAGLDLAAQKAGARVEFNPEKRNPSDFALWKFTPAGEERDMEWETPVDLLEESSGSESLNVSPDSHAVRLRSSEARSSGDSLNSPLQQHKRKLMGFPGWHLECSAMAMSLLGDTIDIHTGGIDHIPVHHTNEIAQSEAATGKVFAQFWLHNNHLKSEGTKISKSLGNGYTLQDLKARGFTPMDFRMFVLQSQYSNESNFTWENLQAAKNRLHHWRNVAALRHQTHDTLENKIDQLNNDHTIMLVAASQAMREALNDDLNTPKALRIVDEAFSKLDGKGLRAIHQHGLTQLLESIDELLGLNLLGSTQDINDETKQLILEREHMREAKKWDSADELRAQLEARHINIRDTESGPIWEYTL